jgi:hypothetical protein
MRFGRIILLASLAQLLGLSALAAALAEQPASIRDVLPAPDLAAHLLPVVLEPVFHVSTQTHPPSWEMLALTALADTHLRRAVWMVAPAIRTVAVPRPRRFALLRC